MTTLTGTVLSQWAATFQPIIDRLGELTTEFIPYLIGIFLAALGISLTWKVVKMILSYLKGRSTKAVRGR